jgi:hypothetical protein
MVRLTRHAPEALLGIALAASVALLLLLTREMTFIQDTWEFLMNRREVTADTLLTPHNEHIVVLPVAIEQVFLRVFGMDDARPEYLLMAIALAATALLLFLYVRRRVGPWLGLFAAVLLLFLGPAWEVLLWPFELTFVGSLLFGIAMLLALDREDRGGDVVACLCLCLSFGFSGLGVPFAAAAAVDVLQKRRRRGLGRAYVVLIPALLFGLWYLGWGSEAKTHFSLDNLLDTPRYVFESAAAATGSLFGLGPGSGLAGDPIWARALLVVLVVAFVYRQLRRPGIAPGFWPVAAAATTNWFLTAFNQVPGREPTSSRYQYVGAILVLLLLANLLQGARFGRRALAAIGAVTLAAVVVNLAILADGRDVLRVQAELTKADLGAIEIARRTVDPSFGLTPEIAGTATLIDVQAAEYLAAVDEYGSPAYSPSELGQAPHYARRWADVVLSQALPLSTFTRRDSYDPTAVAENCVRVPAGDTSELSLSPGVTRIEISPGPEADFSLRRFSPSGYPVPAAGAPGNSVTLLEIPRDGAPRWPWYLRVEASQTARVCR